DRSKWVELTNLAESLGLFDERNSIGFRTNWEELIASKGFCITGGTLLPLGNEVEERPAVGRNRTSAEPCEIQRHRTALTRATLSAPIQLLLRTGLLSPGTTLFDYGCGRGTDIAALAEAGFEVAGWDPYFAPANEQRTADIVNLGF